MPEALDVVVVRDVAAHGEHPTPELLHRVGEPEEIAAFVRFLIGPESSWISGQNLSIDGGQSVRKGADYGAFAKAAFGADPKWQLVEEGN